MRKIDRTGNVLINNRDCKFTIIRYKNASDCDVQFDDGTILKNLHYSNLILGAIVNPNHPSVFDMGYLGIGNYKSKVNGIQTKQYIKWCGMLERCYSKTQEKRCKSYFGCSVDKRWLNFQIFAKWYDDNNIENFELDKDILFKGNKIYSPETCCFVPKEINVTFTKREALRGEYPIGVVYDKRDKVFIARCYINEKRVAVLYTDSPEKAFQAYKIAKEREIKRLADKWRDQIEEKVYQALYRYEVEITD